MAQLLDASSADFAARFETLLHAKREQEEDVGRAVRAIIADVQARGDDALIELSEKFDKVTLTPATMRVSAADIAAAEREAKPEAVAALEMAAVRIEAYHRRQKPADESFTDAAGATLGWRWRALESVGLYVPGGTASYPSSVLMNAVPARVAGVSRVVMVTPASGGAINPLTLVAARIGGVSEIYRVGGAQAVAALAYGTATIPAVDKIVGPGNAYVAAAKREVFGRVGIDSIAGPSEILVVADAENDPAWIAADLLSQAEHDASSQSILIADNAGFANRVAAEIERQLALLPRREIAGAAWRDHGAIIVVKKLLDAAPLIDRIAPEHLEIATSDPHHLFAHVRNAGAVFLGRHTPEAIGDYVAGPNHVLPTSRTARFSSGLSVLDFMKRTTMLSCDAGALAHLGPAALTLAGAEGLDAHARSISIPAKSEIVSTAPTAFRIASVALDEKSVLKRAKEIEDERAIVMRDLLENNQFAPHGSPGGPYHLILAIAESRLVFDIRLTGGAEHKKVMLSLTPFRRVVKDYFMICESYYAAVRDAPAQIEAIDMGRRGLHDEGAAILRERLKGKIEMDNDTARRLFTLICVLHMKGRPA